MIMKVAGFVVLLAVAGGCGDDDAMDAGLDVGSDAVTDSSPDTTVLSDTGPDAVTPPSTAAITFPPRMSAVAADSIVVTGVSQDDDGIAAVRINGVEATSTDGFGTWEAAVSLSPGDNALLLSVEDTLGNVTDLPASTTVVRRMWFDNLQGIDAVDSERVLLLDIAPNAIIDYSLATGDHSVLSGAGVPDATDEFVLARSIQLELGRNRLLVVDRDRPGVLAVDLATGARTVVSDNTTPAGGPQFVGPTASALAGTFLYVLDDGRLLEIDTETGTRRLVSGAGVPDDENLFDTAWSLAIDETGLRALVAQRDPANILAVDLVDGSRTLFSDNASPAGMPEFRQPSALEIVGDELYATSVTSVLSAALASGVRTEVSTRQQPLRFSQALDMTVSGSQLLLADRPRGRIVSVALADGAQSVVGGNPFPHDVEATTIDFPLGAEPGPDGRVFYSDAGTEIHVIEPSGARAVLTDLASDAMPPDSLGPPRWDDVAGRLLVADFSTGRLFAIDVTDGSHSVAYTHASSFNVFELDSPSGRIFLLDDADALQQVMLDSGTVTFVGDAASPGVGWTRPRDLAWDAPRDRLLVVSHINDAVVAIDPATGARSLVDEDTVDSPMNNPVSIVVDGDDAYILGQIPAAIWRLDLSTGERVMLSGEDDGGPFGPEYVRLDALGTLWVTATNGIIRAVSTNHGAHVVVARR